MPRPTRSRPHSFEAGQVAVGFLALFLVLLGLVGLVVDGGNMLLHYRLGRITVDSAALAAATKLDEREFRDGGQNAVVIEVGEAYAAAQQYAALNGQGRVAITGISVSENRATVSGSVTAPTFFLALFNIPAVTFNLSAEAELTYGITAENQ
jgi:Flp pilus assembly protein TadG